jgi:hypothetical protein
VWVPQENKETKNEMQTGKAAVHLSVAMFRFRVYSNVSMKLVTFHNLFHGAVDKMALVQWLNELEKI